MPQRFHISAKPAPPRSRPIGKLGIVDFREDCANCKACVKRACVYGIYRAESDRFHNENGYLDYVYQCRGCLSCVQNCTKQLLTRVVNPEFLRLGGGPFSQQAVLSTWFQAETGAVPVTGCGYGGPFSGDGFDSMWTDMSEIVRPTRDGIHGRETISTSVDIGRKLDHLVFDQDRLAVAPPPLLESPLPLVFGLLPPEYRRGIIPWAVGKAAESIGLFLVQDAGDGASPGPHSRSRMIPLYRTLPEDSIDAPLVMLVDSPEFPALRRRIADRSPDTVVAVRVMAAPGVAERVKALCAEGADVIDLCFDPEGREQGSEKPRHMRDVIREVHGALVRDGSRDQITLMASGGIAMAEHVVKAILCGVDLVSIDLPLVVALECRLCGECARGAECRIQLADADLGYAVQRIQNLMASWHGQIIEMLGAMGIREIRRIRGETGRAIFYEQVERELFGWVFDREAKPVAPPTPVAKPRQQGLPVPRGSSVRPAPPRYRNEIGKFLVIRSGACIGCETCVAVCPADVHRGRGADAHMPRPRSDRCRGPECNGTGRDCVSSCPEHALTVLLNPCFETLGDSRWTPDLIAAAWNAAESGKPPPPHLESEVGASGGGFDRLRFRFPPSPPPGLRPEDISTELLLNRRRDGRPEVTVAVPWYGGGMSFGSANLRVLLAKAQVATAFDTFTSTGEGGYPDEFVPYADHVITQVATGLFGVREETIQRARIVEFKYAQGAKPGLGGHLLGDKNTPAVAALREAVAGFSLFSPFPFHSVYSVEDHKKHLDWIAHTNPRALLSAKVSTPTDVDMVAVGSYHAGAHIVHLDGSYGGTGAAPDLAKKNIAMPIEYAIVQVHRFLVEEGIRDELTIMASGGLRTPMDAAKAIALGADGVVIGTAELIALGCVRCGSCESGRGCARGLATTDPELLTLVTTEWCAQRLINLYAAWRRELVGILYRLGLGSVAALRGRTDLLTHLDYESARPS